MKEYISLKSLAQKFEEHAVEYEESNANLIEQFKLNNPDSPLPAYLQESFNLPRALSLICSNLVDLKNHNSSGVSSEHRDAQLDAASEIVTKKSNTVKRKI